MQLKKISRALISVSDKTGIVQVAHALRKNKVEILASDGTAAFLKSNGIEVHSISQVTGAPEMLDGKVKTLHPAIHAAILANPDIPSERAQLTAVGPIDAVIVNLYPTSGFDIGGPALIRAGAKNCESVSVITSASQYDEFIAGLSQGFSKAQREVWARAALVVTAEYDLQLAAERGKQLRYGENPHQGASLVSQSQYGVAGAEIIQGKAMSFNNYLDVDAAWKLCNAIPHSISIVKHGIPSGVAFASDPLTAYQSALACDPTSAFGGVVASSQSIDESCALEITKNFAEVVVAPSYSDRALEVFTAKTNLRIVRVKESQPRSKTIRAIDGGYLVQEQDEFSERDLLANWKIEVGGEVDSHQKRDLEFAWRIAAFSRSNAIVIVRNMSTIGIGAGNVNRLDAARSAVERAHLHLPNGLKGSVAASDAFFPFPDALQILAEAGVSAIVHPGGSINDAQVIAAAREAGITLYSSGIRHFSHG
jgi:phosphoribosylaminoimidazolecarboxamide formyltransferase/IMP cyclohydrolase